MSITPHEVQKIVLNLMQKHLMSLGGVEQVKDGVVRVFVLHDEMVDKAIQVVNELGEELEGSGDL